MAGSEEIIVPFVPRDVILPRDEPWVVPLPQDVTEVEAEQLTRDFTQSELDRAKGRIHTHGRILTPVLSALSPVQLAYWMRRDGFVHARNQSGRRGEPLDD